MSRLCFANKAPSKGPEPVFAPLGRFCRDIKRCDLVFALGWSDRPEHEIEVERFQPLTDCGRCWAC